MKIILSHISKRFQKNWIFRDISCTFSHGNAYALLGSNGSGKSTLLRIVAGMQSPSKGTVAYKTEADVQIEQAAVFNQVGFSAPGQEIIDELTLNEFLEFHFSFKRLLPTLTITDIIELTGLKNSANKPIGDYSSGMRQRVKLAQAIFSDTPVLLLDEPCTNLDQQGVEQYRSWIETYTKGRTIVVASNDPREYFFCREQIALEDYK